MPMTSNVVVFADVADWRTPRAAASTCRALGLSPLPLIGRDKRPVYKSHQSLAVLALTERDLDELFRSDHEIGIAAGYSGVIVIDIDAGGDEARELVEEHLGGAISVMRGARGCKMLFRGPWLEPPAALKAAAREHFETGLWLSRIEKDIAKGDPYRVEAEQAHESAHQRFDQLRDAWIAEHHLITKAKAQRRDSNDNIVISVEVLSFDCIAVIPPSRHPRSPTGRYEWGDTPPSEATLDAASIISREQVAALLEAIEERERPTVVAAAGVTDLAILPATTLNDTEALDDLEREAAMLAATPESGGKYGGRNHALNISACRLGHHVGAGRLTASDVEERLRQACTKNGLINDAGEQAFRRSFASGLRKGIQDPSGPPRATPVEDFGAVSADTQSDRPASRVIWIDDQPLNSGVAWLVEDTIPIGGVGFLAAIPGQGKTFLLVDLALSLAFGVPFFDRKLSLRGGTHVVAAEGAYGVPHRFRAAIREKFEKLASPAGVVASRVPVTFERDAPDLLSSKGVARFIKQLEGVDQAMRERYGVPLRLVATDTFAQSFAITDENAAAEIAKATRSMQRIADSLGVSVISSHHYGKDANRGMRGSSALRGNVDFVMAVKTRGELVLDKCREAPEGLIGYFDMPIVEVGKRDDGTSITSRYIRQRTAADWPDDYADIDGDQSRAGQVLRQSFEAAFATGGQLATPAGEHEPRRSVQLESLRPEFYQRWGGAATANRQALNRALEASGDRFGRTKISGTEWVWQRTPAAPRGEQ
jgi:AAA domain/Bifunctional DNA primase/polymerase, N-terminal